MLTEFLRDQAFAIAWLAIMAAAWFGWSQEDPKPRLRAWLGVGSVIGIVLAVSFGLLVWRNWATPTALEGRYWIFGLVVVAEVLVIGVGCLMLARRGLTKWYGWWIALCVALHFPALVWVFDDWSYLVLTVVQVIGLALLFRPLRHSGHPASRWACPWMGLTFLCFAVASAILFLATHGYPF